MAKTLEQLYEELGNNDTLSAGLVKTLESGDKGAIADWLKEQDCDASIEEAKAFLTEKASAEQDSGELTPEQLESAAGGTWTIALAVIGTAFAGITVISAAGTLIDDNFC